MVGATYPALEPAGDAGAVPPLHGILYRDVDAADVARLDRFEGPEYRRITVEVEVTLPGAGAIPTAAEAYLFIEGDRIERRAWDPELFRQGSIDRFLADHPPPSD